MAVLLVALGVLLGGCEGDGHGIVVGVRPGRPGLAGRLADGRYEGLDVQVAGYVARRLGYRDDQVTYVELGPPAATPSPAVEGRPGVRVDLAMGVLLPRARAYVPPPGTGSYALAGPYLVSAEDILVPAGDLSVRRLRDLTQKRVCTGSPGPLVARFGVAWQRAFLITSTVEDCARMLAAGRVDAVTDDAAVLAGVAAASPGSFRLVGYTFSRHRYGLAVRTGGRLYAEVDDALRAMYREGAWRRAVIDNLGSLAAKYTSPPPLERYVRKRSAP